MQFIFKAKTQSGEIKSGNIVAENEQKARELLQKSDLIAIDVHEKQVNGTTVFTSIKQFIAKLLGHQNKL